MKPKLRRSRPTTLVCSSRWRNILSPIPLYTAKWSIKISMAAVSEGNGGCITTFTCDYDNLPGVTQDEAKIEEIKAKNTGLFKQVEEYFITNPTLYC
ncbi:hypothetical protein SUGI_0959110 [Cryptomeria japonica]|nr:hypothetical protein SUGI_0959110 [Cryptomeria japonica]